MTTQLRQLRRLQEQLDEAHLELAEREEGWQALIADRDASLGKLRRDLETQLRKAMWKQENAEAMVKQERLMRIAAQQWIADHYKATGQTELIGYEPRKDPEMRSYFANGLTRDIVKEIIKQPSSTFNDVAAPAAQAVAQMVG